MLAIVAVCALLGGFAAFAATLGRARAEPGSRAVYRPGDVTGTLAPGAAGVGPHRPQRRRQRPPARTRRAAPARR